MWLKNSSVGRKVVMSLSGLALILFLTFHMAMNLVALFSPDAYNTICELLGANWYALVGSAGLAALIVLHIVYSIWLTLQNRKARGNEKYAVVERRETVKWASQNMFVLGAVVLGGLAIHLYNFWYKMQFQEILGNATFEGISTHDGAELIARTFANPVYSLIYIVWLVALWFHLTHGFWSALQSLGLSNKLWINRWRAVSNVYTTLLILGFASVVVVFFIESVM